VEKGWFLHKSQSTNKTKPEPKKHLKKNCGETEKITPSGKVRLFKIALLVVAISFFLYTLYYAIIGTLFLSHFPLVIARLPQFIKSSNPNLQLGLFLFQELSASVGNYLGLVSATFGLSGAVLFFKNDVRYLGQLWKIVLFESLFFLLLFPAALNHLIGTIISTSALLNFYTGVSFLIQTVLIFPALFTLSCKLRKPQNLPPIIKWVCITAPLYVFSFWVRHGFLWVYALSPSSAQNTGLIGVVGSVNSLVTLLVAAIVTSMMVLSFRQKKKVNMRLVGVALILIGSYFFIYDIVSLWVPIYREFLILTDFWMITLTFLGIAVLLNFRNKLKMH